MGAAFAGRTPAPTPATGPSGSAKQHRAQGRAVRLSRRREQQCHVHRLAHLHGDRHVQARDRRRRHAVRHFASRRPVDHNGVVVDNTIPMRSSCCGAQFPADRPLAPTLPRSSDHPVWTAPHQPASAIAAASRNTRLCTRSCAIAGRACARCAARQATARACRRSSTEPSSGTCPAGASKRAWFGSTARSAAKVR